MIIGLLILAAMCLSLVAILVKGFYKAPTALGMTEKEWGKIWID
jgi:hypothetical protein